MFKILKIGEIKPLTIKDLRKIKERIDEFPVYQRYGKIWSPERKKFLIDTIINEFDIPKFYFNYFIQENNILNPKNFQYAIIDGKQRLEAIFEFLNNEFALDKKFVFYKSPEKTLANLKFSQLAMKFPEVISLIENYVLDIVYVVTDEEDKLEELFLRLNGGYALTNAEKRNAVGGYLNTKIREIVESESFFINKVKFNNPRYQYQDVLTKFLFIELNKKLINLGNKELEQFLRKYTKNNQASNNLLNETLKNLKILDKVFHQKDNLLRSKGIIPVYYQFTKDKIKKSSPKQLRQFYLEFENLRLANRKLKNPDTVLQEFDRLNQQGIHRAVSLISRYEILESYFKVYSSKGSLKKSIKVKNIEIDDDENFDEY